MRTLLVDRRLFWPGFVSSLGGVAGANLILAPFSSPSTSDYAWAVVVLLVGPVLVACSAYPLYRKRDSPKPYGTSLNSPHETTWPETQLIPANVWVLAASVVILVAGIVTFFLWPPNANLGPGTHIILGGLGLALWPWVLLWSVLWVPGPPGSVRPTPRN